MQHTGRRIDGSRWLLRLRPRPVRVEGTGLLRPQRRSRPLRALRRTRRTLIGGGNRVGPRPRRDPNGFTRTAVLLVWLRACTLGSPSRIVASVGSSQHPQKATDG
jgi:hypothetical protein